MKFKFESFKQVLSKVNYLIIFEISSISAIICFIIAGYLKQIEKENFIKENNEYIDKIITIDGETCIIEFYSIGEFNIRSIKGNHLIVNKEQLLEIINKNNGQI